MSATVSRDLQTRKTVKIAWWFRAFHYNRDPYTNGHPQPFIKISTFRKIAKKVRKIDEKWKWLLYPIFFLCWKTRIKHPFPSVLELESDFWRPIIARRPLHGPQSDPWIMKHLLQSWIRIRPAYHIICGENHHFTRIPKHVVMSFQYWSAVSRHSTYY